MTRTRVTAGILALAILAVAFAATRSPAPSADRAGGDTDAPRARPHCGGQREAFSAAFSSAPYRVFLPATTAARRGAVKATWDCPGSATLMEFSSGLTVAVDVNTIADPAAAWQALAESDPRIYSVGEINGVPASFIDPDADPNDDAEGGVTFVIDGVYVSVGGNGKIPLRALVAAAERVRVSKG